MTESSMPNPRRCAMILVTAALALAITSAGAQETSRSWIMADQLPAARAEGSLTIYSSMNEQEGLPLWKLFEDAVGVKVNYVRASDSIILSRIAIENRARQRSWDLAVTTTVNRLPSEALMQFDPPEAGAVIAQARDPHRRWYGVYANFNIPALNTVLS